MTKIKSNKVVLIQPQNSFHNFNSSVLNIKFDSIGLLALSSFLSSKGYDTKLFHFGRALLQGIQPGEIFQAIDNEELPLVFGISINWLHLSEGAIQIASVLKRRYPQIPVVVGGQHASLFASDIVQNHSDCFDGVVVGEGEETLLEIASNVKNGKSINGVPGLMTFNGNINYSPRKITIDINSLPFISYSKYYPEKITDPIVRHFAALDTTRGGCPKKCNYCLESSKVGSFGRDKSTPKSTDYLAENVELYVKEDRYYITIQDQLCVHGSEFTIDFLEKIIAKNIKFKHLSIFIEPGCYSNEVYDTLEKIPVDEISLSYGIETGSPNVAKNINRMHDYDEIYRELEYVASKKFIVSTWWMVGLPGETDKDIDLTKKMIIDTNKMGIHARWVTPLILFPQTDLAKNAEKFKITPIYKSFDDFRKFATVAQNEFGIYPELITHESDYQPAKKTIEYVVKLKQVIKDNESIVLEKNKDKHNITRFSDFKSNSFF